MGVHGFIAVGTGAALGAWLRWGLGVLFNPVFPTIPLGTLVANLSGGYLIGISMGVISNYESLAPEVRLLITTGFLGGLTTFSTFSAETVNLILRQQYGWAAAAIAGHVTGSLLMTGLGILTVNLARS